MFHNHGLCFIKSRRSSERSAFPFLFSSCVCLRAQAERRSWLQAIDPPKPPVLLLKSRLDPSPYLRAPVASRRTVSVHWLLRRHRVLLGRSVARKRHRAPGQLLRSCRSKSNVRFRGTTELPSRGVELVLFVKKKKKKVCRDFFFPPSRGAERFQSLWAPRELRYTWSLWATE